VRLFPNIIRVRGLSAVSRQKRKGSLNITLFPALGKKGFGGLKRSQFFSSRHNQKLVHACTICRGHFFQGGLQRNG
jgi:hypothetical protein